MKNMQIAGTGNSRFMKSAISETTTWEEFREMLRAGTFAFDFNGINEAGITEKGTPYDVDSVLKDTTAELLGGDSSMVPDEALVALKGFIDGITPSGLGAAAVEYGSYTGKGSGTITLTFKNKPKIVIVKGNDEEYTLDLMIAYPGMSYATMRLRPHSNTSTATGASLTWGERTLSWSGDVRQLNGSGKTYQYAAFS